MLQQIKSRRPHKFVQYLRRNEQQSLGIVYGKLYWACLWAKQGCLTLVWSVVVTKVCKQWCTLQPLVMILHGKSMQPKYLGLEQFSIKHTCASGGDLGQLLKSLLPLYIFLNWPEGLLCTKLGGLMTTGLIFFSADELHVEVLWQLPLKAMMSRIQIVFESCPRT